MVVGTDRQHRAARREQAGGQEEHHEDDDDDPSEGGSAASSRSTLERPTMALAPRESGLHLWPHDSIGGVNGRMTASRSVETTRRATL